MPSIGGEPYFDSLPVGFFGVGGEGGGEEDDQEHRCSHEEAVSGLAASFCCFFCHRICFCLPYRLPNSGDYTKKAWNLYLCRPSYRGFSHCPTKVRRQRRSPREILISKHLPISASNNPICQYIIEWSVLVLVCCYKRCCPILVL